MSHLHLHDLLSDEMSRVLDRVASDSTPGGMACLAADQPDLRLLMDEIETRLTGQRLEMLRAYTAWQATLEQYEDLWALARVREGGTPAVPVLRAA